MCKSKLYCKETKKIVGSVDYTTSGRMEIKLIINGIRGKKTPYMKSYVKMLEDFFKKQQLVMFSEKETGRRNYKSKGNPNKFFKKYIALRGNKHSIVSFREVGTDKYKKQTKPNLKGGKK